MGGPEYRARHRACRARGWRRYGQGAAGRRAHVQRRLLPIDLAVRDWARRDAAVAERLRRVDNFRIAYLRTLLGTVCADDEDLEARCLIAFSVAIADHFIAADHGTRSRADVRETIRRRLFTT